MPVLNLTKQNRISYGEDLLLRIFNNPADFYLFKVNDGIIREMCTICSNLTIKASEQRQWRRSGVFIINFEQIEHIVLVFPLRLWTGKFSPGNKLPWKLSELSKQNMSQEHMADERKMNYSWCKTSIVGFLRQLIGGKIKIRLAKPALNNFKA